MKHTVTGCGANALLRAIAFGPDAPQLPEPEELSGASIQEYELTFFREMIDVTSMSDSERRFVPGRAEVSVKVRMHTPDICAFNGFLAHLPDGAPINVVLAARTCVPVADQEDTWWVEGVVVNAAAIMAEARTHVGTVVAALERKPAPKPPAPLHSRGINITGDF